MTKPKIENSDERYLDITVEKPYMLFFENLSYFVYSWNITYIRPSLIIFQVHQRYHFKKND